jgi:hypothetical protein
VGDIEPMSFNGASNLLHGRKEDKGPWKSFYAWRPIKLHGEWVWFEWVFRRKINTYVDYDNWDRYEYGNIFDIIKE